MKNKSLFFKKIVPKDSISLDEKIFMKSSQQQSTLATEKLKLCDDYNNNFSKDNVENNFEHNYQWKITSLRRLFHIY